MTIITENKKFLFEEEVCSRCGGGGEYSYCTMYGTKCFKCHGKGSVLTKRGRAAQDFLNESQMIRAGDLKVGDVIRTEMIVGCNVATYTTKIVKIETDVESGVRRFENDVWIKDPNGLRIETVSSQGREQSQFCSYETKFRIFRADDAQRRSSALEYQKTLTKSGTVSKKIKKDEK